MPILLAPGCPAAAASLPSRPMRASDIRRGQAVIIDGTLYVVTNADHNTPGNLRAKVQFKLRDVNKGTIQDKRVGATDNIETATLDRRTVEYLYSDGDNLVFMDTETYDQPSIPSEVLGHDALYLTPNTQMQALYHDGNMVSYELPKTVDHDVTETPPAIKGATATNQLKDATTETGLNVKVPPFINPGDRVKVNTTDGSYIERVSK
jgi:elongation factor P